jgi:hypothetical protein
MSALITPTIITPNTARAKWTPEKDDYLVVELLEQKAKGKGTDGGGFKKEAWVAVCASFNARFSADINKAKLKSRLGAVCLHNI